ncbi:MAG: Fic family protein [Burkholderiaceae bacterium]|jgi:Fic family protein|nr:Fic family protein [Burkholderiaceae bacterium]
MPDRAHSSFFGELDQMKARLDAARPLPEETLASLRAHLALEWTYHSNAIEGNTLTLRETQVALEGITIGGKSLREHLEAINHRDAIHYVERLVSQQEILSERAILEIHSLVLKGIYERQAGRYRQQNVVITGASARPANFLHVRDEVGALLDWHGSPQARALHLIEREAQMHARFERIHPFIDGNGRTGRLLLNLELMKAGYPPTIIQKEDRLDYYQALDTASMTQDYMPITCLVASAVKRSLELYLELLDSARADRNA